MATEVKYIIENRKFKQTWDDYMVFWEFIIPVLTTITGLSFLYQGNGITSYLIGTFLIIFSFSVTKFLLIRLKQLSGFEELENKRTKEENFEHCVLTLQTFNIVEIDNDIHNLTINAKCRSTLMPTIYEWLTIVCLDNKILVNSRPTPTSILFWLRRNAMIEFKKKV